MLEISRILGRFTPYLIDIRNIQVHCLSVSCVFYLEIPANFGDLDFIESELEGGAGIYEDMDHDILVSLTITESSLSTVYPLYSFCLEYSYSMGNS